MNYLTTVCPDNVLHSLCLDMAPEVFNKKYDCKVDIWSAGVICFILLCGSPPFEGETDEDIERAILQDNYKFRGRVWDFVSEDAMDFVQELLTYEPDKRPTAAEALQHKWLQSNRQRANGDFRKRSSDTTRSFLVSFSTCDGCTVNR